MFGRKPPSGETPGSADRAGPTPFQNTAPRLGSPAPARPAAVPSAPQPATSGSSAIMPPRRAEPSRAEHARDTRKLIVGRDITLSGEIVACDHLIVEGTVDASVRDCHRLEITENGLFRGKVEIAEAEIAGRVEGDIVVHGRLTVRASGHVQGKIQYGELSVEAGGRVDGHISGQPKPAKPEERAPLKVAPPDEPASIALSFSPAPSEDVAPAS